MLRSLAISWVPLLTAFKNCVSQKSVFTECGSVLGDFPAILPLLPTPWVPIWGGTVPAPALLVWRLLELLPFVPSLPEDSPQVSDASALLVSAASLPFHLQDLSSPQALAHPISVLPPQASHSLLLIIRAHSHPPQSGTFPVTLSPLTSRPLIFPSSSTTDSLPYSSSPFLKKKKALSFYLIWPHHRAHGNLSFLTRD